MFSARDRVLAGNNTLCGWHYMYACYVVTIYHSALLRPTNSSPPSLPPPLYQ